MSSAGQFVRAPNITVLVDHWAWPGTGKPVVRFLGTEDVTQNAVGYEIDTNLVGMPSATVSMTPNIGKKAVIDAVLPMDVVRIQEFGVTKFQGYVRKVSYNAMKQDDGATMRTATLQCESMVGLLAASSTGINMGVASGGNGLQLKEAAAKLIEGVSNAINDGTSTYKAIVNLVTQSLVDALSAMGVGTWLDYAGRYIDYQTAITTLVPGIPSEFYFYSGLEEDVVLWSLLQMVAQAPITELWSDVGPRTLYVGDSAAVSRVSLPRDMCCIVLRPTPFDATDPTITHPFSHTRIWSDTPAVTLPKLNVTGLALVRSVEDVHNAFFATAPTYSFDEKLVALSGFGAYDLDSMKKYLLKTLKTQLYFTRTESETDTQADTRNSTLRPLFEGLATTLRAWYKNADQFMSGAISYMVPDGDDPRVGDKLSVEGIRGEFYVQGVVHNWTYGGAVSGTATVSRGMNGTRPIAMPERPLA